MMSDADKIAGMFAVRTAEAAMASDPDPVGSVEVKAATDEERRKSILLDMAHDRGRKEKGDERP